MFTSLFLAVSAALFAVALLRLRKSRKKLIRQSIAFLLSYLLVIMFIGFLVADSFTGQGIDDSVVFHLKHGLQGAGFMEYAAAILTSFVLLGTSASGLFYWIFRAKTERTRGFLLSFCLLFLAFALHPAMHNAVQLAATSPVVTQDVFYQDFYQYYRKPSNEGLHHQGQKNLVIIYAESLEYTYFDEALFPNLMPNLKALSANALVFPHIQQAASTAYTIAGITASLCGVPMHFPSHGNSLSGMDEFMQGAFCTSDLLKAAGYNLHFMGGANASFAGKGKFFETHGFTSVEGSEQLSEKLSDPSYRSNWGLYDDSLLPMVLERFKTLSQQPQPFGLVTLTLDTHHPKGHVNQSCEDLQYQDGKNDLLNAVACADKLLAQFIHAIMQSEYASNTTVVLLSDHLALNGQTSKLLQNKAPEPRTNLFMVFDQNHAGQVIETQGHNLDIASTLLALLGFPAEIGLGRNLLAETSEERAFIHANIKRWTKPIMDLWEFPALKTALTIHANTAMLDIDQRTFRVPSLITFDEHLQSTLYFEFDRFWFINKSLRQHKALLSPNTAYLYVEHCSKLNISVSGRAKDALCLEIGIGKLRLTSEHLTEDKVISASELKALFNSIHFKAKPIKQYQLDTLSQMLTSDISLLADRYIHALDFAESQDQWLALMQQHTDLTVVIDTLPNTAELNRFGLDSSRFIALLSNPYDAYRYHDLGFTQFIWQVPSDMQDSQAISGWRYQLAYPFAVWLTPEHISDALRTALDEARLPYYVEDNLIDLADENVNQLTPAQRIYRP